MKSTKKVLFFLVILGTVVFLFYGCTKISRDNLKPENFVSIPIDELLKDQPLEHDTYFKTKNMDLLNRVLFTFASYNAGPNRITRLRKLAESMGFDPNIWFRHVEVAAAKKIGRETVQYVSNIYKYYVAYRLVVDKRALKKGGK